MLASTILYVAVLTGSALAVPITVAASSGCTAQERVAYAKQIPYAYAQPSVAQTYQAFSAIPFGVPNLEGTCTTVIYPNGGSGVPVTATGQGVVNFGTETRQVFSSVTGQYKDFGANGTTVIYTNVTLGAQSTVVIPVTFSAQVYLDFNNDCRISAVRAYAEIPTYINGMPTWLYQFLPVPETPLIF